MHRRGFTLLEVMAVVVLLGLMAAATAWSLADQARSSSRGQVVAQLANADAMARRAAARTRLPCVLKYDLEHQRVWRALIDATREEVSHSLELPTGFRIERMVLQAPSAQVTADISQMPQEAGVVPYSTRGRSPTYAVHLTFPGPSVAGDGGQALEGSSVWLVFSGLTGQMTLVNDDNELNKLLETLATGPDAD